MPVPALPTPPNIGQQLCDIPIGALIRELALGIADAQLALDLSAVETAQMMSGGNWSTEDEDGTRTDRDPVKVSFSDGNSYSLMELGFTPTFYQFIDTIIEVKLAIKIAQGVDVSVTTHKDKTSNAKSGSKRNPKIVVSATSVDAKYTGTYSYTAEGSSLVRTKLVPVPPPPLLEERIRRLAEVSKVGAAATGTIAILGVSDKWWGRIQISGSGWNYNYDLGDGEKWFAVFTGGLTASEVAERLADVINLGGSAGSKPSKINPTLEEKKDYGPNLYVTAVVVDNVITLTAKTVGAAGNGINLGWPAGKSISDSDKLIKISGTTLTGGRDPVAS